MERATPKRAVERIAERVESCLMAENRLPFAAIRRAIGAPQIEVEVGGRIWKLHLVDGQYDHPAVELVFGYVDLGLAPVRLRVDDSELWRERVPALLRLHIKENVLGLSCASRTDEHM